VSVLSAFGFLVLAIYLVRALRADTAAITVIEHRPEPAVESARTPASAL
jgi:hypothetical protein